MIRIGTTLYGFCGGCFQNDSHTDKRVEAIGADWIVVREIESGIPDVAFTSTEQLEKYTVKPEEQF